MPVRGGGRVVVGVHDQRRATEFWTSLVGFALHADEPYDDTERWIEIRTPDGLILVLALDLEDRYRHEIHPRVPNANPFFYADDVEQTYRDLTERGVIFAEKPSEQPWGWWSMFWDTEGNRFALQQS